MNLIEEIEDACVAAAIVEDHIRLDPRGPEIERILEALKAAKSILDKNAYQCGRYPCAICDHTQAFNAALRGEESDGAEVESSANVPPKAEYSGKGWIVHGEGEFSPLSIGCWACLDKGKTQEWQPYPEGGQWEWVECERCGNKESGD